MELAMRALGQKPLRLDDYSHQRSTEELPSPATSGYSEFGSELDTPDSGRVSEVESSPKMAHHSRAALRGRVLGENDKVEVEVRMLKALAVCVRDNQARLAESEAKMRKMEGEMAEMQARFQQKMVTLVKAIVSVRNDCSCGEKSPKRISDGGDSTLKRSESGGADISQAGENEDKRNTQKQNASAPLSPVSHRTDDKGAPVYAVVRKTGKTCQPGASCSQSSDHADKAETNTKQRDRPANRSQAEEVNKRESRLCSTSNNREISSAVESAPRPFTLEPLGGSKKATCEPRRVEMRRNSSRNSNSVPEPSSADRGLLPVVVSTTYSAQSISPSSPTAGRFPMENPRPSSLVTKLMRKIKEKKKPKLSRGDSKDSLGACSGSGDSSNELMSPAGVKSELLSEDVDLANNNNNQFLLTGVQLKSRKSILSYTAQSASRPTLDSIGNDDVDSLRSADVPDAFGTQQSLERAGDPIYERISFRRPKGQRSRRLENEDEPSSPRPVYSVVLSHSDSEASDSFIRETVENELYRPSTDTTLDDVEYGSSFADLSEGRRLPDDGQCVILDEVEREQEDRRNLETGGIARQFQDDPPAKPSRPGFPSTNRGYNQPPAPVYQATAPHGMYPHGHSPAVPPKVGPKIMTSEEITRHEAEVKLRQKQLQEASLEEELDKQKIQAEQDSRWLEQEEQTLNPRQTTNGDAETNADHLYHSADDMQRQRQASMNTGMAPPPPTIPPEKPPRVQKDVPVAPPVTRTFEEVKPAPTMKLDRSNDSVYRDTMNVVKSVLQANQEVMNSSPEVIFELVKTIGKSLKDLCTSLEQELPSLPPDYHKEIDMAQKTTNKDLSQIINQTKLVKRFHATTQVTEYKKCLMAATQVLAIDAKNLLDVVDKARQSRASDGGHSSDETAENLPPPPSFDSSLPPPPSEFLEQG